MFKKQSNTNTNSKYLDANSLFSKPKSFKLKESTLKKLEGVDIFLPNKKPIIMSKKQPNSDTKRKPLDANLLFSKLKSFKLKESTLKKLKGIDLFLPKK